MGGHGQDDSVRSWRPAQAVDDAGNVYAVAERKEGDSFFFLMRKYDADGNLVWTRSNPTGIGTEEERNRPRAGFLRDDDLYAIWDIPDNVNVAAASLMVNASGAAKAKITVLLTPEEIDRAAKMSVDYSGPGQ